MKRVLAYVAILVVAAGCSLGEATRDPGDPVDMTPSTLAGTWHAGTERFLTFREDGSFGAINLPPEPFSDYLKSIGFDPSVRRLDGSGTWTLKGAPGQSTAPKAIVHLNFGRLGDAQVSFDGPDLDALRPGDGQVYLVAFYTGSQGNSWTGYLKCASDCALPGSATPSISNTP